LGSTRFALQFAVEDVPAYAARFSDEGDRAVLAIGRAARERGWYTRDEFVAACRWKTPRSGPLVAQNSAREVEERTRIALGDPESERERLDALLALRGVGWPTASVLLHLADPDRYPILDRRALDALGVRIAPSAYGFRFWEAYVNAWLALAERAGVGGRALDKALWQWSKEHEPPPAGRR
jgi:hypothetical protein